MAEGQESLVIVDLTVGIVVETTSDRDEAFRLASRRAVETGNRVVVAETRYRLEDGQVRAMYGQDR